MPFRDRVERERKHRERAGVTGGLHLPRAELEPGVGVPQLDREPDPRHRQISETLRLGAAELAQRTLQRRRADAVTVDETRGQPVEHQVVGSGSPGRRRAGAGGCGDLERPGRTGEMHAKACRPDRLEMRGAAHSGVERRKTPGRGGEQRGRIAAAPGAEGDLRLEQLTLGVSELVQRSASRSRHEGGCGIGCSGGVSGASRRERTLCAPLGIRRQRHGALAKRRCRGKAAASLRAAGRGFQLGRDGLVGPGGGVGAMPCPPILVVAGRNGLGKRRMDPPTLGRRGEPVDGRSGRADGGSARGCRP